MTLPQKTTDPTDTSHLLSQWHPRINGSKKLCTLGMHPDLTSETYLVGFLRGQCDCFDYRAKQCCVLTPCKMHGCSKKNGCLCPLPVEVTP